MNTHDEEFAPESVATESDKTVEAESVAPAVAEADAPSATVKKTAEADAPSATVKKTAEEWFEEKKSVDWHFLGARLGQGWPVGKELTEAEYNAAIETAQNVTSR